MAKKNWDQLLDKEKILFLEWIRDGLHFQAKRGVENRSYYALIMALQGREEFSVASIYDRIHESTIEHLGHTAPYEEIIDAEIEKLSPHRPPEDEANESKPKKKKKRVNNGKP